MVSVWICSNVGVWAYTLKRISLIHALPLAYLHKSMNKLWKMNRNKWQLKEVVGLRDFFEVHGLKTIYPIPIESSIYNTFIEYLGTQALIDCFYIRFRFAKNIHAYFEVLDTQTSMNVLDSHWLLFILRCDVENTRAHCCRRQYGPGPEAPNFVKDYLSATPLTQLSLKNVSFMLYKICDG